VNDQITVGAASLLASLVAGTWLVRWAVATPREPGRHRAQRTAIHVPLAGLMPAWPDPQPSQLGVQAFRECRPCGGEVPVVVHGEAHRCGDGHVTITAGAA